MKRLKIKKQYGVFYYEKIREIDMEFDLYYLYNEKKEYINTFAFYNDMKYFIETDLNLSL